MATGRLRRITATLGLLAMTTVAAVAVAPPPAMADSTRIISGTTSCYGGAVPPVGPYVGVDSGGWPGAPGPGWLPVDSVSPFDRTNPTRVWTKVIPASATSIKLDVRCYVSWSEYYGYITFPEGTWQGSTYSLTPGTSTINSTWSCNRQPVAPGPWVRTCTLTAMSSG
ncbi:hypothetical protein WEI85_33625 [Actinomycetes bacterium KLBMP 9797]